MPGYIEVYRICYFSLYKLGTDKQQKGTKNPVNLPCN